MKNWLKTMLCAVSAAALVACGGGDSAPAADAGGGGGGGGGGATPEAIAAMGTQGFVVANFGIGGAVDGMLLPVNPPAPPSSFESPAAEPPSVMLDRCKEGGSATQTTSGEAYVIVYNNCVHPDSDVKYHGTVTVAPVDDDAESATEYTVDFDSTGLQISLDLDGKSYSYIYKNRAGASHGMVLSDITRSGDDVNKVTSLMNVAITIGTGSVTLEDYKLEFDSSVTPETIKLSGKYIVNLKTSDFGVTLPAGVPDMAFPLTFVTSTDPVLTVGDGDEFTGGTLKLEDATLGYKVETNFTTKKLTITVAGVASTYDL